MRTLVVIRHMNGHAPTLSFLTRFQQLAPEVILPGAPSALEQAVSLARGHLDKMKKKFPEFGTPACKWYAYLSEGETAGSETFDDCIPLQLCEQQ
jgi:hypothetical protein